jgi:uncharacterized protein
VARKSEYNIGFTGLTDGKHQFTFEIENKFFEQLGYTEFKKAKLHVQLELEKKPNMMIADFAIDGVVNLMCDRCTDYFDFPLSGTGNLIYKFSENDLDDENVVTIYPNETDIDVAQPIYEFTLLMLPARRVHPEGKCNQEMLKDIDNYLMVEQTAKEEQNEVNNDEVDPRWAALDKLKNKNNNKK